MGIFMENQNSFISDNQKNDISPVLSFYERLDAIKDSVGFEYICERDKPLAHECCLIICEVMHRPYGSVLIGGESVPLALIGEVYTSLTSEHIQHVCDKYNSIRYEIKRKKQYLRSALYNSVFELESSMINDVLSLT